ncbi:MAG: protein phosphatase 2C domain-containing protein [Mycobacteriales bacterium]
MIEVTWGAQTHNGHVRQHNEDALLADAPVFVVADGMGGHRAGEVASSIAIDQFRPLVGASALTIADVAAAITAANEAIVEAGEAGASSAGMGTTVVGMIAVEQVGRPYWLAFNVGDSRLYRLFKGELNQVSVDHSYVQELIAAGRLTADEAIGHPERNIVTRALGQDTESQADFWLLPPEVGERFLLCSDGLSGDVSADQILQLLRNSPDPEEAADQLVSAALAAGGRDNISVVVVDVRAIYDFGAHEATIPRGGVPNE